MKTLEYLVIGLLVAMHGLLETTRYFWRNLIVEFPPSPWPAIILIVLGIAFLVFPFVKDLPWFPRKSVVWSLGTLAVFIELWLLLEPLSLELGRFHPTLVMGLIIILSVTFLCIRETRAKRRTAI